MCLNLDTNITTKLRKRKTPITVYKLYYTLQIGEQPKLQEYYRLKCPKIDAKGNIHSNRKSVELTKTELRESNVKKGIHAYLQFPTWYDNLSIVIKATADPKDLVGADEFEAAFTKITLSKKDTIKFSLNKPKQSLKRK